MYCLSNDIHHYILHKNIGLSFFLSNSVLFLLFQLLSILLRVRDFPGKFWTFQVKLKIFTWKFHPSTFFYLEIFLAQNFYLENSLKKILVLPWGWKCRDIQQHLVFPYVPQFSLRFLLQNHFTIFHKKSSKKYLRYFLCILRLYFM